MNGMLSALRARALGALGALSMYRLVLLALGLLAVIAFAVSFGGRLAATPLAILASAAVLVVSTVAVDIVGHRVVRRPARIESSLITALILLFVLWPSTEPAALGVLALAGAAASASKYLLAVRGRHLLNPAAVGAAVVTTTGLGASMWWVGSPLLAAAVVILGLAVVLRAGQAAVALSFVVVATVTSVVFAVVQSIQYDLPFTLDALAVQALFSSPVLFLGLFMLTEPLTLPTRRGWRLVVAVVVGLGVGWPVLGPTLSITPEVALLVGNLLAFAVSFDRRRTLRLTLVGRRAITPTITELTLRPHTPVSFDAGQYLELGVSHRRPDRRGTRREFSLVTAPGEAEWQVAYRTPQTGRISSYKRALAAREIGDRLTATGVYGSFTLPDDTGAPVLLVAAGIGVTPFVSQLTTDRVNGTRRDVVVVLSASAAAELAYVDDLASARSRGVVFTPDEPADLPVGWTWAGPVPLTPDTLAAHVPDIAARRAYVSGAPSVIRSLAPALAAARSVRTDAFAGY